MVSYPQLPLLGNKVGKHYETINHLIYWRLNVFYSFLFVQQSVWTITPPPARLAQFEFAAHSEASFNKVTQ